MAMAIRKKASGKRYSRGGVRPATPSDAVLLGRARRQDVRAFEELVKRTEGTLYRLAMRYVGNESDAREVLQNAYLSAWRGLPTFEGRSQFTCWMHRITVNAALMCLRVRTRHREVAINEVEPDEVDTAIGQLLLEHSARAGELHRPDIACQSAELRRRMEVAIHSLPHTLRTVFLLRDVWEVSTEESAARLKVSIPAAKTRLHRARRVLRASLGQYVNY